MSTKDRHRHDQEVTSSPEKSHPIVHGSKTSTEEKKVVDPILAETVSTAAAAVIAAIAVVVAVVVAVAAVAAPVAVVVAAVAAPVVVVVAVAAANKIINDFSLFCRKSKFFN